MVVAGWEGEAESESGSENESESYSDSGRDTATETSADGSRKFGKTIQVRALELPEYSASFMDYKGLKKVGDAHRWCRPG